MSKLIDEPVQVTMREGTDSPASFVWRRRQYRILHLGPRWHRLGKWWEGEPERVYLRAIAGNGGAYDLCYDPAAGEWRLYTVHD